MDELKGFHFYRRELFLYFAVYFAYLIYGFSTLVGLRKGFQHHSGQMRDPYNYELNIFNDYVRVNWYWYMLHAVVATISRFFLSANKMGMIFASISVPSLFTTLPLNMAAFVLAMVTIFYLVACIGNKNVVWIATALWVALLNALAIYISNFSDGYGNFYTLSVILFWTLLRCCSFAHFCVDSQFEKDQHSNLNSFTHFVGYALYFPTLANGPFLDYKRYIVIFKEKNIHRLPGQLKSFAYEIVRIFFWWLILELGMRYLYVHYMAMVPETAKLVKSPFGRHAIGYFLGQSFFMTYLVKYGLGIAFSRYDGMQPPNKPQCIGHVHYYSNMWKRFDQGLYEFLFDYIYHPLVNAKYSKFVATVITFTFVFMWHGCQTDILIWTVMNFWCLIAEKLLKHLIRTPFYKRLIENKFGLQVAQRFHAVIFSQLFIIAAFSNVFFIGSPEMGAFLMLNAYGAGFVNYLALSFCCYCFFQCSELISMQLWKTSNAIEIKSKITYSLRILLDIQVLNLYNVFY